MELKALFRCLAAALLLLAFGAGCAKRGGLQPEATPTPEVLPETVMPETAPPAPAAPPAAEAPAPMPTPIPTPSRLHYIVKPGDSLWKISAMPAIFKDAFEWPLLFKANRDQIVDPDLIEPKQDLSYEASYPPADVSGAVEKAKETPPYKPHTAPRKELPINY